MSEEVIFAIILHAGNARTEAYEALRAAQAGDFAAAENLLARAEAEVGDAHRVQADIIQKEAQGEKTELSLLLVHAQDHLMTAIAEKNLIENMIAMHRTLQDLTRKLEATRCQD
jgi:PTS system cellobiose-specific IIA component